MKTKVFIAAMAVAFSFAVMSCGGKKAANAEATAADSTKVEAACCCKTDSTQACTCDSCTCDSTKVCCKADSTKACEKKAEEAK